MTLTPRVLAIAGLTLAVVAVAAILTAVVLRGGLAALNGPAVVSLIGILSLLATQMVQLVQGDRIASQATAQTTAVSAQVDQVQKKVNGHVQAAAGDAHPSDAPPPGRPMGAA